MGLQSNSPFNKISTLDVLKICAVGVVVASSVLIPTIPMVAGYILKFIKNANKTQIGRVVKRLEKQEMISISEKNGKTKIEITEKGKKRLLEYDFENISLKAKKPDGKWRLIVFDIPENKKRNRDAFRKKLLQLNCVRLQDSVFASAYPIKKEVDFLCHYLEISDFVTLAVVNYIERGEKLIFKKYYDSSWES